MTTFLYKAYKPDGSLTFGSNSVSTHKEMVKYCEDLGLSDIEIFESKTPYRRKKYAYVSAKEIAIFCKEMSVMVFSYITIVEGIQILSEQTENKYLKTALTEMHEFLENGFTLSQTMSMYKHIFGEYLTQMVCIGEESGNLDVVFSDVSLYYEKENEIHKKLRSAILYPVTLSVMMFAIIIFLVKSILPMFDSILVSMGATVSPTTEFIMGFGRVFDQYFILIIFAILVLIGAIVIYFGTDKGAYKLDKIKATWVGVSYITERVTTAKFSRSFNILLKSGVDIVSAVDKSIGIIDNKYLYEKFSSANEKIKEGSTVGEALGTIDVFPALFLKMVVIGEKTGNLEEMLYKTTEIFEEEAYDATEKTTKLIEPILITILSVVIGIVLISIIMPMINIMSSI